MDAIMFAVSLACCFFFFQAEDGIRDGRVTGVQTCALPISITVYADGLMSYGPTRNKLGLLVDSRIDRLLHLDLVPGLRPMLLTEFGVPSEVEIGRASCRERGESWGCGGGLEKKREWSRGSA